MIVFISQQVDDIVLEKYLADKETAINNLKSSIKEQMSFVSSYLGYYWDDEQFYNKLHNLSKSIEILSTADLAYFGKGWENYTSCRIEHECAKEYGIRIIEE